MPTLTRSKGAILRWWNTLQKWEAQEDIHEALHPNLGYVKSKLRFLAPRITEEVNVITRKYFYLDEKGDVKYEGEPGKEMPCMLPDKKLEEYDKEVTELMKQKIEIKL